MNSRIHTLLSCSQTQTVHVPGLAWRRFACFLTVLVCVLGTCRSVPAADAAPPAWSKSAAPKELLTTAQSILDGLQYYRGFKGELLSDTNLSMEVLRRKRTDGVIETKTRHINRDNGTWCAICVSKEGKWLFANDLPPKKLAFEDGDDVETRIAAGIAHPYLYSMKASVTNGSNVFLVISRRMSPRLFQAMLSSGTANEDRIACKHVYYIRRSDGLLFGRVIRNIHGVAIDDQLCDVVDVHTPISAEYLGFDTLKNAPVAASESEFREACVAQAVKMAEKKQAALRCPAKSP